MKDSFREWDDFLSAVAAAVAAAVVAAVAAAVAAAVPAVGWLYWQQGPLNPAALFIIDNYLIPVTCLSWEGVLSKACYSSM